jgi:pilus assembly protein CpaC
VTSGLDAEGKIRLVVNKTTLLTTKGPVTRVSVGQQDIADVNPIGANTILVTAKKPGSTQIIIWDDANHTQAIDVTVESDLAALQDQFKQMFPDSEIKVNGLNGAIVLRGHVANIEVSKQAEDMAGPYGQKVLNFTEVAGGQQVELKVKFAEVSRSVNEQLGVNFGLTDGVSIFGNNIGQVNPLGLLATGATGTAIALAVPSPNAGVTQFGRAAFGNSAIDYFVQALRQNNLMRILAEPNLTAMSGKEASFLAGGEFPIPVTQGVAGGSSTTVTIQFREFGVKLKMTPLVLGGGRIRLTVAPEVSDLDFTTAVRFNGFVVPGLTSRKVSTVIELNEGQTFSIAGLLNNSITSNKDVTPLLGDLPILGVLFRSVRFQRKETELVVLVTPHLVEGTNPDQTAAVPGEKWRDPNEYQLFLEADLGGPIAQEKPKTAVPPRYHGQYGFAPSEPAEQKPVASVDQD